MNDAVSTMHGQLHLLGQSPSEYNLSGSPRSPAPPKGEPIAAHGQARPLYNLSVGLTPASSPGRGALGKEVSLQRKGELAGLSATPEPPLLGEVALRSNDGEVVQSSC